MSTDLEAATADAAHGDGEAFRAIFVALAPRVSGYFAVRGAEDPEGLTNEVFIQVLPRLSTLKGGWPGLQALVFTIAHARAIDDVRYRSRRPTAPLAEDYEPGDHELSAETQVLKRLDAQEVFDVLELLSEEQRSVVTLRILADLSVEQTALVMGKSPSSVKKLQQRALALLRSLLSADSSHHTELRVPS